MLRLRQPPPRCRPVRDFCARMVAAGRSCELLEYPGKAHGFFQSRQPDPGLGGASPYDETLGWAIGYLKQLGIHWLQRSLADWHYAGFPAARAGVSNRFKQPDTLMRLAPLYAAAFLALSACGGESDPTATASTEIASPSEANTDELVVKMMLPDRLDCLRHTGGVLVVGHRGGPTRDYPENAIETFQRSFDAGTRAMEIDVRETKDGQLILMHDEDLDRTTTGTGLIADHTLAEIQALFLETYSKVTAFHPPTLADALEWAVRTGAVVMIDKKRETPYAPMIAAIRDAKAENNAILITYTDDQAVEVHTAASELVISATIRSAAQLEDLIARGVYADRLIAWTETDAPKPELWQALAAKGVESDFGTLGPRASSLDTRYWDDGDGSEYNQLVADGVALIATDLTDKVSRQLAPLRAKAAPCGL